MKISKFKIQEWKAGAEGFLQWLRDMEPRIPSAKGGFEIFRIQEFQEEAIRGALERREGGSLRFGTIVLTFPRRHSKTVLAALIVLWRFTLWQTQNIKVLANTECQRSLHL